MSGGALEIEGEWTATTAGGCPKHASWAANPQFPFELMKSAPISVLLSQPDSLKNEPNTKETNIRKGRKRKT